jgi:hypothetical protein
MIEQTRTTYPPCTGTIHRKAHRHPDFPGHRNLLGTSHNHQNPQETSTIKFPADKASHATARLITSPRIASRTSEHSTVLRSLVRSSTPLPRSDNPSQNTRTRSSHRSRNTQNRYAHPDAPKPIHPDKEQFCSSTLKLGQQTSSLLLELDLHRNKQRKKPKLDFPITNNPNHAEASRTRRSLHPQWWRWTESNRRPPACKAGALPIELHPQSCGRKRPDPNPRHKITARSRQIALPAPTLIHGGPGRT